MIQSGYVLAGFETLATIMDNFILNKRGRWNENFSREDISKFLAGTCSGFLHSYGQDFFGKKKYGKYSQKEADLYRKCRAMGIFDNCNLIADSGGFQISIGKLTRAESELLFKMYYEWLKDHHEVYDRAFILDIPPGPGCEIFHDFYDVYKWNLDSYLVARDLPDHVRKKVVYVHHFRTPKLWEIYTKIMRENDLFPYFEYHGTGGIVANMSGDMAIPCIIYVLPLVPLINEAIKHNRDYLNFHILGGGSFRDVFFYELFKKLVESKHGIKLNLTYDSSMSWKQVMRARFIHVEDPHGYIRKMSVKTVDLDKRFFNENRTMEMYEMVLNEIADKYGFKRISIDGVYSEETNTFHEDIKVYSILYTLHLYSYIQEKMREVANNIYPLYEAGQKEDFFNACFEATRHLNQGKLTKKQETKTHSISRSLDMLVNLDEEYCQYLVNRFLAKDEFRDLDENMRMLTC